MKIISKEINNDTSRAFYWMRVYLGSDDESQETKLLVCVTHNYIFHLFNRVVKLEEIELNKWFEDIIKKWESRGEVIFKKKINYESYAKTPEGMEACTKFLKEEVAS